MKNVLKRAVALSSGALCSSLVFCGSVLAEPWIGVSAFGIQSENFQKWCPTFLKTIDKSDKPAVAILFNTFGSNDTCLKSFWERTASAGKEHLTVIHFSNEAGRRAGTLDNNDLLRDLSVDQYNELLEEMPQWLEDRLKRRVRNILALVADYSTTGHFILSAGLEDNYTLEAWSRIEEVLREEWPGVLMRNPALTRDVLRSNFEAPADVYYETHGYRRKLDQHALCSANGDGQDVAFLKDSGLELRGLPPAKLATVRNWLERAVENNCMVFLWAAKWQGFFIGESETPLPLSREFQWDEEDIPQISSLFQYSKTLASRKAQR
jgi:hypothetical protein